MAFILHYRAYNNGFEYTSAILNGSTEVYSISQSFSVEKKRKWSSSSNIQNSNTDVAQHVLHNRDNTNVVRFCAIMHATRRAIVRGLRVVYFVQDGTSRKITYV